MHSRGQTVTNKDAELNLLRNKIYRRIAQSEIYITIHKRGKDDFKNNVNIGDYLWFTKYLGRKLC